MLQKEGYLTTAGGKISCRRCQAKCKATQQQCRAPAVRDYEVCRVHGARGGPRTGAGLAKCAEARLIHGKETRTIRESAARSTRRIRAAKLAIKLLDESRADLITDELITALIDVLIGD
jgi:hypothetical protein